MTFFLGVSALAKREPDGAPGLSGGGDVRILGPRQRQGYHLRFPPSLGNPGELNSHLMCSYNL